MGPSFKVPGSFIRSATSTALCASICGEQIEARAKCIACLVIHFCDRRFDWGICCGQEDLAATWRTSPQVLLRTGPSMATNRSIACCPRSFHRISSKWALTLTLLSSLNRALNCTCSWGSRFVGCRFSTLRPFFLLWNSASQFLIMMHFVVLRCLFFDVSFVAFVWRASVVVASIW